MARRYSSMQYHESGRPRDKNKPLEEQRRLAPEHVNLTSPCETFNINIATDVHVDLHDNFYSNKVVLAFEGVATVPHAC